MSLFAMVRRALAQRKLGTFLTAFGVALGVMLTTAVLMIYVQVKAYYDAQGGSYPCVVGAEGYDLQLVQNVVYHTDRSPGNVPYAKYRALLKEPWVKHAVPYAVGDSFRGYRVVGTTDGIFDPIVEPKKGTPLAFAEGRKFAFDPAVLQQVIDLIERGGAVPDDRKPKLVKEAVVGAEVAKRLKLKIGEQIEPTHGLEGDKKHENTYLWTVVGILKPTGTAVDRVIYIGLDSFLGIDDHLLGGRMPDGSAGISAILLWTKGRIALATMVPRLDAEQGIQAVRPAEVIRTKLYDVHLKPAQKTLLMVTLFNVLTGIVGVGVALYNTMNERRREIAILRAVGARRGFIVRLLVGEATAIAAAGALGGLVLSRAFLFAMQIGVADFGLFGKSVSFEPDPWRMETAAVWDFLPDDRETPANWSLGSFAVFKVEERPEPASGDAADRVVGLTVLGMGPFEAPREPRLPIDFLALFGAVSVGALAGFLPAMKGYRTPVAENLAPLS
jgi:putative ABC transport system permease protein